ncbi:MAG: DUF1501 domain-containing protein [Hyphomonas sp.]
MTIFDRRNFLKAGVSAGFLAGTGALGALTSKKAFAAETSGYKALVAIFLKGGMDHADTVLPYDQPSYDLLKSARSNLFNRYAAAGNSRSRSGMLPLHPLNSSKLNGLQYALPPELSGMRDLFDAGDLAILGNVGPLIEPINRATMADRTASAPPRLFSHNDQQSSWMALATEGEKIGWAGRFADAIAASDSSLDPTFLSVSAGPNDVFLSGSTVSPFATTPNGAPSIEMVRNRSWLGNSNSMDEARAKLDAFLRAGSFSESNIYERDFTAMTQAAIEKNQAFNAAMASSLAMTSPFPSTGLGKQLEAVAATINIRNSLKTNRQIFYVTMGGFDTHNNQTNTLPAKHREISEAISAFRTALINNGAWNDVTLFTMSDFGRTTIDNGDGTDHGWGAHHFIAGGSVDGQKIYGEIPPADLTTDVFTKNRGRLIPTTSVEQYAATLGSWFGLEESELARALPNLSNFTNKNIGFLAGNNA